MLLSPYRLETKIYRSTIILCVQPWDHQAISSALDIPCEGRNGGTGSNLGASAPLTVTVDKSHPVRSRVE